MAIYNLRLTKVLEDGTEVIISTYKNEPGWYMSPMLSHLGKRLYEPKPKPKLEGEVPLFDVNHEPKLNTKLREAA